MHYREIELQLALLEKTTSLLKRRQMIQELEHKGGYAISYNTQKGYQAKRGDERYQIPVRHCPHCNRAQYLHLFFGRGTSILPWCKPCRSADPTEAKRACDRLRQQQIYQALSPEDKKQHNAKRAARRRKIRQAT